MTSMAGDLPIEEPTRIDWAEVERRRLAHGEEGDEEPGDLPEGQQSNPVPPDLIDILDRRAGRKHSEFGSVVSCLGEILAVHEARVRADVAGAITADLQAARRAAAAPASMESLDRALRIVARHAVAPS